jgi:uncharacterized protein (TIGR03437 family)
MEVAAPAYFGGFMFKALLCGCFLSVSLAAQTIAGAGYMVPGPVSVAPGHILTFFVDGIGTTGIAATLRQFSDVAAPVIDVQPIFTCSPILPQTSCGSLVGVTVQIPYELVPACPLCAIPVALLTELIVSGNGHSAAIQLNAVADQVHVLTACDIVLNKSGSLALNNNGGLPCSSIVTHADGTMVTATSPANPGEELIAWATGLGATNPRAVTGQAAIKPLPTAATLGIHFNYAVNALATKPRPAIVVAPTPAPAYSGLAPGFVGLYQINFVVPPGPSNGIARCASPGTYAAGSNPVLSNLTVSFGGGFSFDGAGICVATQIPVD